VNAHPGRRRPRLLGVFAHPDDETLACGGTLALCARGGTEVTIYSATAGQAGGPQPARSAAARERLAATRTTELHQAAARLGAARVVVGPFRDGFLPHVEPALLEAELARLLEETAPDVVVTFGRDGLYWHPDHVALGERTAAVLRARRGVALYFVLFPREAMSRLVRAVQDRVPDAPASVWGIPAQAFGLRAAEPTHVVDVREAAEVKLEALRCHRSQLPPGHPLAHLDAGLVRDFLGEEWFRHEATSAGPPELLARLAGRATAASPTA
jgi:LmbE family N-acetylglucosaminyl deacetylase